MQIFWEIFSRVFFHNISYKKHKFFGKSSKTKMLKFHIQIRDLSQNVIKNGVFSMYVKEPAEPEEQNKFRI